MLNCVRIWNVVLVKQLWGTFCQHQVVSFELFSTLFSGCVHTKNNWIVLVGLGERIEFFFWIVDMALVSNPKRLWDFVVE